MTASFVVYLFSSCVSLQEESPVSRGDAIHFNAVATTVAEETKTAYSGVKYGSTIKYERVNWVAGDCLRIASAQCPEPYADYEVSEVSGETDQNSSAQISPTDPSGHGLTWGDGVHDFYAIYPAPSSTGAPAGLVYSGGASVTLPIPATQAFSSVETSTPLIKMLPDMNYAYMYATTRVADPSAKVSLEFKPLFTAFEITVGSDGADELDLYSFYMTATQNLSGTFTATMNAETGAWSLGTVTSGTNRIDVSLGGTGSPTKVNKDKALTFTIFALPQATLSGIVLHFETSKGLRTLELKYSGGSWIEVHAGQKAFIEGLKIPGTVRTYIIEPISNLDFWGVGATSGKFDVRSYSESVYGVGVPRNEKWKIEYSSNYNESSGTGDWYDTPAGAGAGWLGISGASLYDGSQETLTASIAARSDASKHETGEIQDIHTLILHDSPAVSDYDLSMHTIHGDSRSLPVTANCYVVKAPGTYVFPIVYGNAIDGTKSDAQSLDGVGKVINKEAYWPSDSNIPATAQYFLKRFFNADNVPITSPFIIDDLRTSGSITDATSLDAIALWQDGTTTPIITAKPTVGDGPTSSPLYSKCKYISFTIDKEKIRQGNIVIALRDVTAGSTAAEAKIIWSWQIWVTDEDLHAQEVETQNGSVQLMPVNVGWSDIQGTVEKYNYNERSCYMRITQVDSTGDPLLGGASTIFKAIQHEGIGYTVYASGTGTKAYLGSSPFYQFGRKDPFLGRDYTIGDPINIKYSAADGYAIEGSNNYTVNYVTGLSNTSNTSVNLGMAIQNPFVYYNSTTYHLWYEGKNINSDWVAGFSNTHGFHNLWNAYSAGHGEDAKVRKTIYDPCPPDFCLPRRDAFTGFTLNGADTAIHARINGDFDSVRDGYHFYKKKMTGTTASPVQHPEGGSMFFCRTGLRREGSLHYFSGWGAYWTAERNANYAIHLVLDGTASWPHVYPQFDTDGRLADSWSIRPALEEAW